MVGGPVGNHLPQTNSRLHKTWPIYDHVKPFLSIFIVAFILMGISAAFRGFLVTLIKPILDYVLQNERPSRVLLGEIPLLSKKVFLDEVNPFPFDEVWLVLGLLGVIATIFKGASEYSATYLLNYFGQSSMVSLRQSLYEKVVYQSSNFFYKNPTGSLISRITNDIEKIQFALSTNLADALKQILALITFLSILIFLDWKLSIMIFLVAPLIVVPSKMLGRIVRKYSRSSQDKLGEISNILQETISGNRIVKAFSMETFELSRFRQSVHQLAKINLKALRIQALPSPLMEILGAILIIPLLYYVQKAVGQSEMTPGGFGISFGALLGLYEPIRRMSGIYQNFQHAKGASSKVFEIMQEPKGVVEKADAVNLQDFHNQIEFRQVSFNYPESGLPVLAEIDLTVRCGEVVALVGPSGSGKSSLVNLIPRFFDVTEGEVLIDGVDIRDLKLSSLRSLLAIVTQETFLFDDTLRNNICYGKKEVTEDEMRACAQAALADDFIAELPRQYDSRVGERGQKLSGGQRQRLAIARALLKNSPILILDEATSSLDTEAEILVQQALTNLMQGRTVIVIAHRLSTIRRADRIVVIDQGKISEVGTHADLMEKKGIYQRVHDLQFEDLETAWTP